MPALRWIDALKEWNKVKSASDSVHSWAIPRKGSEGYQKVKKLMDDSKKPSAPDLRKLQAAAMPKAPAVMTPPKPDLRKLQAPKPKVKGPTGPDLRKSLTGPDLRKK